MADLNHKPTKSVPNPASIRACIHHSLGHSVSAVSDRKGKKGKRARYRYRRAERRRAAILAAGARFTYTHKDKQLSIIAPSGLSIRRTGKHIASLSVASEVIPASFMSGARVRSA